MKKFLQHSVIFLLPFMVLFGVPMAIFLKTGELTSVTRVIDWQKNTDTMVLFGRVYTDSHYDRDYKIEATLARKPEILLLGTSRVLGYRAEFFKDKNIFYNAGRSIRRVSDLSDFLNKIPQTQTPKVVMLGLDQNFFFHEWQEDPHFKPDETPVGLFFKHNWRLLYSDYLQQKFTIKQVMSPPAGFKTIGLNAVVHQKGFRNDGSFYYGDVIGNKSAEIRHQDLKKEITAKLTQASCRSDYYGESVRQEALLELANFLKLADERGVKVIGFISPYSPSVYGKIQLFEDACSRAAKDLDMSVGRVFKENHAQFYDVSDVVALGSSEAEFFDAGHYSEKLSVRLLIRMAESNELLKNYVDVQNLREQLNKSQDNFTALPQP